MRISYVTRRHLIGDILDSDVCVYNCVCFLSFEIASHFVTKARRVVCVKKQASTLKPVSFSVLFLLQYMS